MRPKTYISYTMYMYSIFEKHERLHVLVHFALLKYIVYQMILTIDRQRILHLEYIFHLLFFKMHKT